MNRRSQSVLVLIAATLIAVAVSHLVVFCLKMNGSGAGLFVVGKSSGKPPAFVGASSIGGYGIAWDQIANEMGTEMKCWGSPGATPIELEQLQKKVPEARTTFIVVSTYDLDEARSCEFRARIVPLDQAIASLKADHADWQYAKGVLSQYPVTWLQVLFPTLGRSRAVMGTTLMRIQDLILHPASQSAAMAGPVLKFGGASTNEVYASQKLSDWSRSKVSSKLESMRVQCQGEHSFAGAKKLALERMLRYANQRGQSVVLVMPVSASYSQEFVTPELARQFEATLADIQRSSTQTAFLRLDQLPGVTSDENFCDLLHMNPPGQKLATDALMAWVRSSYVAHQP